MSRLTIITIAMAALCALAAAPARATPGKTDARGCHSSKKVGFHCHPKPSSTTSESPQERSARLKRECKGRPNAGACLGLTS